MNIELVNEIRSLVEEYINEVSDELVDKVAKRRLEDSEKAGDNYLNRSDDNFKIALKFHKNQKLVKGRNKRIDDFKKNLVDSGFGNVKKAEEEHNNALLNQGLRNKLEKSLKVSESCLNDIMTLIEGDIIDFQKKRKEIVLDRNAHKLANMMRNGELDGVRTTSSGELIGDPIAIKKVKDIEKENREVGLGRKVGLN